MVFSIDVNKFLDCSTELQLEHWMSLHYDVIKMSDKYLGISTHRGGRPGILVPINFKPTEYLRSLECQDALRGV